MAKEVGGLKMIPKKIHYCWFGRGPKSKKIQHIIETWHRVLPDYELKEWNEGNFDVTAFPFAKSAYEKRKFAFVADVARLYALKMEGGVYLDTDVEVLKPFNAFLGQDAFVSYESEQGKTVNSGTIGSVPNGRLVSELLKEYESRRFIREDGTLDLTPNTFHFRKYLETVGVELDGSMQKIEGLVTIYPFEYFCAFNRAARRAVPTANTCTIHHFTGSWNSWQMYLVKWIGWRLGVFPARCVSLLLKGPLYVPGRLYKYFKTDK